MIFNIQRYSTHDGPGIRTVVFLKGCSLACRWCQNPESRSAEPEVLFDARLCLTGCACCCHAAPRAISRKPGGALDIARSKLSGNAVNVLVKCCPSQALTVCGENRTVEDIMQVVLRDKPFYQRSGGGVTLSGGEPFMNPELARALLQASHEAGIHTAVETCLHVPWHNIEPCLPFTRLFLADLKHTDAELFKTWTRGSARRVMANLQRLAEQGAQVVIRVPLIPGFNASEGAVRNIVDFAAGLPGVEQIHFLPYHTLGMNKYALLGLPYEAPEKPLDNPGLLTFAQSYAHQKGLAATLRG
ncbi:glycyl-radical enzyme activating protein [Mangrovibacter plantisponsor]|uniref:Pyruvate formate lyase activating enzyme n=1 Tax=Mangrovibacter plantisponsor TaxID=451513 RepID=A0A317Q8A2_9ENTR|nr:glycyl-radical enzyme activating protein [Mangrovibacter plantisponsor]PWW12597.1 pyruvate formate lyase activating enzyme [Mangrovibacter plantisponsor]